MELEHHPFEKDISASKVSWLWFQPLRCRDIACSYQNHKLAQLQWWSQGRSDPSDWSDSWLGEHKSHHYTLSLPLIAMFERECIFPRFQSIVFGMSKFWETTGPTATTRKETVLRFQLRDHLQRPCRMMRWWRLVRVMTEMDVEANRNCDLVRIWLWVPSVFSFATAKKIQVFDGLVCWCYIDIQQICMESQTGGLECT